MSTWRSPARASDIVIAPQASGGRPGPTRRGSLLSTRNERTARRTERLLGGDVTDRCPAEPALGEHPQPGEQDPALCAVCREPRRQSRHAEAKSAHPSWFIHRKPRFQPFDRQAVSQLCAPPRRKVLHPSLTGREGTSTVMIRSIGSWGGVPGDWVDGGPCRERCRPGRPARGLSISSADEEPAGAGSRCRLPGSGHLAYLRQAARAGTTPGPWIPPTGRPASSGTGTEP